MNLRWTILGVILLTFVGLVLILSVSLQSILVPHFHEEEDRSTRLNVQRVLGVMENERISLTEAIKTGPAAMKAMTTSALAIRNTFAAI